MDSLDLRWGGGLLGLGEVSYFYREVVDEVSLFYPESQDPPDESRLPGGQSVAYLLVQVDAKQQGELRLTSQCYGLGLHLNQRRCFRADPNELGDEGDGHLVVQSEGHPALLLVPALHVG